jgi:hypothetical protein
MRTKLINALMSGKVTCRGDPPTCQLTNRHARRIGSKEGRD